MRGRERPRLLRLRCAWALAAPLLLAVQAHAYGEGFGVLDAPVTNHSHCLAGSPQLVFAAPAGCATLLTPRKGAKLRVPVVLTLDGVPVGDGGDGGDGGLSGAPCVQLQVRSSTQHAWYFMIPPAARHDTVVTVCADATAAGANATAEVRAVAGDSAAPAWTTTWTFRTRLHLGAGFHRLGARLDTGGRRGAAAHTARWGALSACAHEASAVLHVGVADEDGGGGGGGGGGAKAAAEREALRATIAEKHAGDEAEAEEARDRWQRLSGQYSELLGGSAGSEAAVAAHAELSSIASVLDGHGQEEEEEEVLDPALLDALRSGEPARLAALLHEVPLGQRRDGTVAAAGAAASPARAVGGGGGGSALFGGGGAGGGAGGGGAAGSNIFTLPMFTRSFGERLARAIDEAKARFGDQMSAPNNGGAGYGFVLDEFGLGGLSHALAREVLAPLARLVHPQWGSSALDGYHVFSLRVEGGEEEETEEEEERKEDKATHIDVCEISMNVCLGRAFRGSGMTFAGEDVGGQAADGVARSYVEHVPGRAILNLCQHHHAGSGTVGGERYSLVVRATSAEFRRSPAESFASRCLG